MVWGKDRVGCPVDLYKKKPVYPTSSSSLHHFRLNIRLLVITLLLQYIPQHLTVGVMYASQNLMSYSILLSMCFVNYVTILMF